MHAPGENQNVQQDVQSDDGDGQTNGFTEAFQEDGAKRREQQERQSYRVLRPGGEQRIFKEVCRRVGGRQRDGDDEPCRRKPEQTQYQSFAAPSGQQLLEHGDAALPVRAELCHPAIHRQCAEERQENKDQGGNR